MPKRKITKASAAAEERHSIKRNAEELRDRCIRDLQTLPLSAILKDTAAIPDQLISVTTLDGQLNQVNIRDIIYMAKQEARIEAFGSTINFITGMAARDNQREGGLGRR